MPLRDTLIVTIVIVLAVMALRRPWLGVMNWTWLSIMNPHRFSWGFAYNAPLAAVAAASTLAGLFLTKERRSPFLGAPVWWLFVFTIWMTVSWLMGVDPQGDYWDWDRAIKIFLMSFVALSLLQNRYHILAFASVTTFSLAAIGIKGGLFTILTGGQHTVWGPEGSFIEDNNHLALATIMIIPMLRFLQLQLEKPWMRHAMTGAMLLCIASAIGSYSRGAFLAMSVMGIMFWWRSSQKGLVGIAMLFVVVAALFAVPDQWWDRISTIQSYEQDGSAMGRINSWIVAFNVAKNYPFGAGMSYQYSSFFSAYGTYETIVRAAHSIYFQILGNHGFGGLFLYLMIWISTLSSATRIRKIAREHPQARWAGELANMIQVSLISFAVGGAFLSMPYFDLPYNMMIMIVLSRRWIEDQAWKTDPAMPMLEYIGLKKPRQATAGRPRTST